MALSEAIAEDLGERYDLRGFVGRGGMATVWLARDEVTGESVAIKRLEAESGPSRAFYRELSLLFRLTDPHITQIHTVVEAASGTRYLILEYCSGGSLRAAMTRARAYDGLVCPEPDARRIVVEVLEGLAAAHRVKVIHRDLKPENILLAAAGEVRCWSAVRELRLTDFGLARTVGERRFPTDGRLGALSGSPAYMAPEQLAGRYGPASDLYALGIIAYELLHGRLPFQGDIRAVMRAHVHESPEIDPSLPAPWPELLDSLLAKSPEQRPPSAEALLERLLGSRGGSERPVREKPDSGRRPVAEQAAAASVRTAQAVEPGALELNLVASFEAPIEALLPCGPGGERGGLLQVAGALHHLHGDGALEHLCELGPDAELFPLGLDSGLDGLLCAAGRSLDWLDERGARRRRVELQFGEAAVTPLRGAGTAAVVLDGPRLLRLELDSEDPPIELQRLPGEGLRPIVLALEQGAFGLVRGLRSPRLERYNVDGFLRGLLRLPGPCWEAAPFGPEASLRWSLRCLVDGRFQWFLADPIRFRLTPLDWPGELRRLPSRTVAALVSATELQVLASEGEEARGASRYRLFEADRLPEQAARRPDAVGGEPLQAALAAAGRLWLGLGDESRGRLLAAPWPRDRRPSEERS